MMLKIDRHAAVAELLLRLTGDLRMENLDELKTQIQAGRDNVIIDVGGVTLIGVEGIRFLNSCEDSGIAIANASPFISEWMSLERRCGPGKA
jgi:anti-anti-sigma regulatory factor